MASLPNHFLTPEEYLALEREAACKSEYYGGEMFAMSGASHEHNTIAGNLFSELRQQLRARRCFAYTGDMRVFVEKAGTYTYPDVTVACAEPRFTDDHVDTLRNPAFLAEVLSPSTESHDRGFKARQYRTIESLQQYALIAQDRMHVELYTRGDAGQWILTETAGPNGAVDLSSIGCRVTLADLYEKADSRGRLIE
jgi:Uma2 family endonuclease